jgi:hypothetical protein
VADVGEEGCLGLVKLGKRVGPTLFGHVLQGRHTRGSVAEGDGLHMRQIGAPGVREIERILFTRERRLIPGRQSDDQVSREGLPNGLAFDGLFRESDIR